MNGGNIVRYIHKGGKYVLRFCRQNYNWILSTLAGLGLVGLTWSTIKGTIKAVKICEEVKPEGKKQVLKTVWKLYIPTAGFFILTTACVVGNAHLNAKHLATMTGLYAASQADLKTLKDKALEVVGKKKADDIQKAADQEMAKKMGDVKETSIHNTGHGDLIYIEHMTGQMFRANPDYIDLVIEQFNTSLDKEVDNMMYRRFINEKFCLEPCGVDDMYIDKMTMLEHGYDKVSTTMTHVDVKVNGEWKTVGVVHILPDQNLWYM